MTTPYLQLVLLLSFLLDLYVLSISFSPKICKGFNFPDLQRVMASPVLVIVAAPSLLSAKSTSFNLPDPSTKSV